MAAAPHISLPSVSSLRPAAGAGGTQALVLGERILFRILQPGGKGALVALQHRLAFPGEFLADALRSMLSRASPNQPASRPSTTLFLAWSVPAAFIAMASIGTATTTAGVTPPRGILAGSTPVLAS